MGGKNAMDRDGDERPDLDLALEGCVVGKPSGTTKDQRLHGQQPAHQIQMACHETIPQFVLSKPGTRT